MPETLPVARPAAGVDAPPLGAGQEAGPPTRSLFGEILDWMLAPLLLLWPMSIAVTYLVAKSIANGPFDRALESSALVLAQQLKEVNGRVTLQLPMTAREILRADETDTIYYQVSTAKGELISGDRELPKPEEDEDRPRNGQVVFRDDKFSGNDIRVAYTYVAAGGLRREEPALVQVAETLDKRAQLANEIIKGVILPQFLILPLAVVLVWFGLTRGLAPLHELQRRIRERRPDDTSPIDEQAAPQEIMPLVASFNDLLSQLDQLLAAQKRFIADAAHQMKTPLAGLQMQAELALRDQTPEELRRSLSQIGASSERAAHMVKQLLSLARMENMAAAAASTPIDLTGLARETVKEWLQPAWAKGLDLGFEEPGQPVVIGGNAVMLREMLNNLIDNAIRYTPKSPPPGGSVTVRVRRHRDAGFAVLEVEDCGPGIPLAERGKVMQRFYRILGGESEGSGLGLAIVKEIVDQHHGEVEILDHVHSMEPRLTGTLIRITFRQAGMREDAHGDTGEHHADR
ncbi:MAG: sensor histidine kinase N-terminal domain-containing protein [Candidatus Protistobacter heckmanni]|nr:sensor histidine kinase N-terminal domain-containing protein [Candidatus Protistobacter heckmanni]